MDYNFREIEKNWQKYWAEHKRSFNPKQNGNKVDPKNAKARTALKITKTR